jgi:hypothetical protein
MRLKPPLCPDPDPPSAAWPSLAVETPQELLLDFKASLQDPSGHSLRLVALHALMHLAAHRLRHQRRRERDRLGLHLAPGPRPLGRARRLLPLPRAGPGRAKPRIGFNQTIPLELSRYASLASLNLSVGTFWGLLPE